MKITICLTCKKETKNPKFCSKSCSAKTNGKTNAKRLPQGKCLTCDISICKRNKYCPDCLVIYKRSLGVDWDNTKIEDIPASKFVWISQRLRNKSRTIYLRSNRKKGCAFCDYSNHFEVHHIVSISNFDRSQKASEVNDLNNLIALCPNHHHDADHGIISVETLKANLI